MNAGPHILYRLFNSDGALLYIGITNDIQSRFLQHSVGAVWWRDISRCTTDSEFDSRYELEQAEQAAIRAEAPWYNVVGNPHQRQHPSEFERGRLWADIAQGLVDRHREIAQIGGEE
jgi:predicted GIY-YIG superfamily endonuclease